MAKKKEILQAPMGETTVLLHTCCAPCSSAIIEAMMKVGITPIIYYCNPNIYPFEEYVIRKEECTRYAQSLGLEIIDADYDHENWLDAVKGMENEPERGGRCLRCFKLRLLRTAQYAKERGIKVITTTLASSRWKSLEQINEAGLWACEQVSRIETFPVICTPVCSDPPGHISAAPLSSARYPEDIDAETVPDPNECERSVCPSGAVDVNRQGVDTFPVISTPVCSDSPGHISAAPLSSARYPEDIDAETVPDPNECERSVCPSGAVDANRLGVNTFPVISTPVWWAYNWKKGGLQERRLQILKEYNFYNQQYCGCEFSMRKSD